MPASAADRDLSRPWAAWIFPSARGLRFTRDVVRELLGLASYRLRGWLA